MNSYLIESFDSRAGANHKEPDSGGIDEKHTADERG